jgi:hypothetical protein
MEDNQRPRRYFPTLLAFVVAITTCSAAYSLGLVVASILDQRGVAPLCTSTHAHGDLVCSRRRAHPQRAPSRLAPPPTRPQTTPAEKKQVTPTRSGQIPA